MSPSAAEELTLYTPTEAADRRQTLADSARQYIRRGWSPIPVPAGSKGPRIKGWQNLRLGEQDVAAAFVNAGNIGLLLGEPSGHLVDVDLDCSEARQLADRFLPATGAITGRRSSPASHRWYVAPGVQTVRHQDPVSHAAIVELRGTGAQTLVGPSIHPSGEPYDPLVSQPAQVQSTVLQQQVAQLAEEVIRLRHGSMTRPVLPSRRLATYTGAGGDTLLRRAAAYLDAMPPAISGRGGHKTTYAAATALVHGFGLSDAQALSLLMAHYNPRCQPEWSESELRHKVADACSKPHLKPFGWLRDTSCQPQGVGHPANSARHCRFAF